MRKTLFLCFILNTMKISINNDTSAVLYQYKPCGLDLYTLNTPSGTSVIKGCPTTRHGGAWGEMYSSYSFWTSALEGGEWLTSRPGRALDSGEGQPVPIDMRLGGHQSWSGHRGYRKNTLLMSGIEPRLHCHSARSQTLYCLSYTAYGTSVIAYGGKRWNCTQGKSQECGCHIVNSI
jgi:hypothetical protein